MAEDIKVSAVDEQPKSIAEKEETVLENAGISTKEDGMYKLDLNKINEQNQQEDAVQEQSTDESVLRGSSENEEAGQEAEVELQEVQQEKETPIVEEITDEQETSNDETTVVAEQEESKVEQVEETEVKEEIEYPENIQDLVKFMNETGGTLEDYVALNKDYEQFEDMSLLHEYYTKSKPHLSADEINFLIEDKFSFDEEIDEPKDIKRKKLAFKEEVAQAKNHLEGQKASYYKEIKSGSRLTPEQQKAMDFFNRYNEESAEQEKITRSQRDVFDNKTKSFFNDQFKGFEYKVGEKRYRFNVKNVNEVKNTQSDINNFVKRFLNEKNEMADAAGYHKSLFTAMNADAIANHFYEQGKADAIKDSVKSAKNIKMDPRSSHQEIEVGGMKARVVSGDSSSGLKLKLKNY
jgi:hypothetical protein